MPERNVSVFNRDVQQHGGYVYSSVDQWSTRIATMRQTDAIVGVLEDHFPRSVRIADLGCGDGTYTIALAERFKPASVRGIDPASLAIENARRRIPSHLAEAISFEVGSIYDIRSVSGEIAVIRGVLHHLDRPQAAIAQVGRQFDSILVLEPNGYNLMLKVIEKASRYHREHDEKSYWPPKLNRWFEQSGYSVVCQYFVGLVPYFCPTPVAKALKAIEPMIESARVVREIACGTNVILYSRREKL